MTSSELKLGAAVARRPRRRCPLPLHRPICGPRTRPSFGCNTCEICAFDHDKDQCPAQAAGRTSICRRLHGMKSGVHPQRNREEAAAKGTGTHKREHNERDQILPSSGRVAA